MKRSDALLSSRQLHLILLAVVSATLIATPSSRAAIESGRHSVGKIVETKRDFAKVQLLNRPAATIRKGQIGQIENADGKVISRSARVTTLRDDYLVIRFKGGAPSVGDEFVVDLEKNISHDGTPAEAVPDLGLLEQHVGQKLTLQLFAGRRFSDVELLRIDKKDAANIRIRIRERQGKRPLTIGLSAIQRISSKTSTVFESKETGNPSKKKFSRKQALLAKQHAKYEAKLKAWEKLLDRTGVKKWQALSDADHDVAIDEHRRFIETFKNDYPKLEEYETEQFIVVSNIARIHLAPYLKQLDAMHDLMMQMYGIPEDVRVWRGKALIVAFVERQQFVDFERNHIKARAPAGAYGVCHSRSDGQVIVACFRGNNPADFGQMLVHETSHGFMHRYKTATRIPSWMNEGLADHLGATIVPVSQDVPRRQQRALERLSNTRSLGGLLEVTQRNIRSDQYGLSSLLVGFLIRNGEERFAELIDHLKAGLEFSESLQIAYDTTPDQMVHAFGVSIGIPNLRP